MCFENAEKYDPENFVLPEDIAAALEDVGENELLRKHDEIEEAMKKKEKENEEEEEEQEENSAADDTEKSSISDDDSSSSEKRDEL